MRTALVGIKPADQVMLKGYLRILLRLEADLEWVSANHPEVDLYLINCDFRQANNIVKLLEVHSNTPVLYVGREESGEGGLEGDLLNLPLKETSILNDWLFDNLAILSTKSSFSQRDSSSQSNHGHTRSKAQTDSTKANHTKNRQTTTSNENGQSTSTSSNKSQQLSSTKPATASTANTSDKSNQSPLIEVIQQLQQQSKGVYQLFSKESLLATIEPSKSLVWLEKTDSSVLKDNGLTSLRLQLVSENPRSVADALDMKQWLWEICWQCIEDVVSLVNHDTLYQLRFWVKPVGATKRRDLLRVMVAMEKVASNIEKIAENSDCSVDYVKKVVSGLLFSGYLQDDIYREIRVDDTVALSSLHAEQASKASTAKKEPRTLDSVLSKRASGEKANVPTSSTIPASIIGSSTQKEVTSGDNESAESKKSPEKNKKQGFLARLRRKLGL